MKNRVIAFVHRESKKVNINNMVKSKLLLKGIFIEIDSGKQYIAFQHNEKTWVMPKAKMKKALDMYQPSTFKGKVLKQLLVICKEMPIIAPRLGITKVRLEVNNTVNEYIQNLIVSDNFCIAGYMGDTSSEQNNKATLQIYNDKEIIAYAKATEDFEIKKTFTHEIEALKFLEKNGIHNVPKVLGKEQIEGMDIFIQSTNKAFGEKVCLKFDEKQMGFINDIVKATKKDLAYEETDFYDDVQYLKTRINDFDNNEKEILEESIKKIEEKLTEKPHEYSFSHGDYTPWNVYYRNNELNAFDFEYCSYSMPSYIDVFHYLTQMSLLGFKGEVGKAVHIYKNKRKLLEQYICNPDFTYLCYLVHIVSFYKKRTVDAAQGIDEKYGKWIGIMEYLNAKVK